LGGHLAQEVDGKERSVSFVSKVFSKTMGGHYRRKKIFHSLGPYNLQYWTSPSASPKIERWKIFLSENDYSLDYIRGEDNLIADALSRVDTMARDGNSDVMFPQVMQLSPNVITC
jgi:hypothetical protein